MFKNESSSLPWSNKNVECPKWFSVWKHWNLFKLNLNWNHINFSCNVSNTTMMIWGQDYKLISSVPLEFEISKAILNRSTRSLLCNIKQYITVFEKPLQLVISHESCAVCTHTHEKDMQTDKPYTTLIVSNSIDFRRFKNDYAINSILLALLSIKWLFNVSILLAEL